MKFYIASAYELKEEVRKIYDIVKERGHEIIMEWANHESVTTPPNPELSEKYSIKDLDGTKNCDIFVLLSSRMGNNSYVELGVALASKVDKGKPEIYIIGDYKEKRMFFFHPVVKRRENIHQVLDEVDKL